MAYGTKYYFVFQSQNGTEFRLNLMKNGYSGTALQRKLGKSPVLKLNNADPILGSSLEFWPECKIDGEYTELYTSNPLDYKVELKRGTTVIWSGYISPELYAEPDIAPPYDVEVVATDGIGELKQYQYAYGGKHSLHDILRYLLGYTITNDYIIISDLSCAALEPDYLSEGELIEVDADEFFSEVDIDFGVLEDKTCYDVLKLLLTSIHASIRLNNGKWLIYRENDIHIDNLGVQYVDMAGHSGHIELKTFGSMASHGFWPVGNSTSEIVPANKSVIVTAENSFKDTILANSYMSADTSWTKAGTATWHENGYHINRLGSGGSISQSISFLSYQGGIQPGLTLKVTASNYGVVADNEVMSVQVEAVTYSGERYDILNVARQMNSDGQSELYFDLPANDGEIVSLNIKIGAYNVRGTNSTLIVHSACLYASRQFNGYRDTLILNNGARGKRDDITLGFTNIEGQEEKNYNILAYACPTTQGATISLWNTTRFTANPGSSYISLIARDIALSIAMPRIRKKGTFNIPSGEIVPFGFKNGNDSLYIVDRYDWDLVSDEAAIEMLSESTATISVSSEDKTKVTSGGSSASGTGGGGGGTGGGGTNNYEELINLPKVNNVELKGNKSASDLGLATAAQGTKADSAVQPAAITDMETKTHAAATYQPKGNYLTEETEPAFNASAAKNITSTDIVNWNNTSVLVDLLNLTTPIASHIHGYRKHVRTPVNEIVVNHPLIGHGGEVVLMVYRRRNGRCVDQQHDDSWWKYKKGWAVALGNSEISYHTSPFVSTTGRIDVDALRTYIVKNFCRMKDVSPQELYTWSYSDWVESQEEERGLLVSSFGLAIRVANPAFEELVVGPLVSSTQEIDGVKRYLYSSVIPLNVMLRSETDEHRLNHIEFGLKNKGL